MLNAYEPLRRCLESVDDNTVYDEYEFIIADMGSKDAVSYTHLSNGDSVVHINISSEFSVCHQNAVLAASEFENVYLVDSRNLSTGSGHIVMEAALMAEQNLPAETIKRRLDELVSRVEASFVVERLDYLYKGGRCSSLAALGGNILGLKPCIEVKDGKMGVGKKYRGSFDSALRK